MSHLVFDIIAWIASLAVVFRLRKFIVPAKRVVLPAASKAEVSIIIPARNEEKNLPRLLRSLVELTPRPLEVIVVDDNSTDDTATVAKAFGAQVIPAGKRPANWCGKNWACHVGARYATGSHLLFTDADTVHNSKGLQRALQFMNAEDADMLSAASFHRNELWWEKLLGPFYCIIHCGASPFDKQTSDRVYAVGQYLLITSEAYHWCNGHAAVHAEVAEDTALARQVINTGRKYVFYQGKTVFSVQMYSDFFSFCSGWIRLLRLGMRELSFEVTFNSMLPLLAMNAANASSLRLFSILPVALTLICFAIVQNRFGKFSLLGILFFPLGVLLFLTLSCWAVATELFHLPIFWKGRWYQQAEKV